MLATLPVALSLAHPWQAWAQDGDDQAEAKELDSITVTARKKLERVQDIPLAVTSISGQNAIDRGIDAVRDLPSAVPNMAISSGVAGNFNTNIIIRGVPSSARNVGFESGLGVYVDGVYLGRPAAFDQIFDDIERVEVLRGPQGTLFGKNTISGAISIVTQAPSETFYGRAAVEAGDRDLRRGSVSFNGPLVGDSLLGKISLYTTRQEGYVDNVNSAGTGPDTLGDREGWGLQGGLLFKATPATTITTRADYAHSEGTIYNLEPDSGFGVVDGAMTADVNSPSLEERDDVGVSLTVESRLGDDHDLTSVTAYRKMEYAADGIDLDSSAYDLLYLDVDDDATQYSQELRLAFNAGGRFSYVAGLYLYRQDAGSRRAYLLGADAGLPLGVTVAPDVETRSAAAFFNADYRWNERFWANAGLRYTYEKKDIEYRQSGGTYLGYPDTVFSDSLSDSDASTTLSLNYNASRDLLLYVKHSTGFKSGGWNADLVGTSTGEQFSGPDVRFDPESMTSYEVGFKTIGWSGRASLNVALYRAEYDDMQISQYVGGLIGFRTTNVGKAHSTGLEVELSARLTDALSMGVVAGYNDAEYDRYRYNDTIDLSGEPMDAPGYNGSLTLDYVRPAGSGQVEAGLAYTFQDGYPLDVLDPNSGTSGHELLDVRLGYRFSSGWSVTLWSKNLLDERYFITHGTESVVEMFGFSQAGGGYGAPRSYGVRVAWDF